MVPLSDDQLRTFAERGYVVIGNVIPRDLIRAAMLHIDDLMKEEPPPPDLWVWPGSHEVIAAHLRRHGPDTLLGMAHPTLAHPTLALGEPEQVVGGAGDVLLAHYLLGHNMGGNLSSSVRRVVYFRLQSQGHASRWRECVQDPLLEFAPVRAVRRAS
jgi:hypothetical protein